MITMAAMSQMRAMFTIVIDRCLLVVNVDRSGLLLMIATGLGSLVVLMRVAMVP